MMKTPPRTTAVLLAFLLVLTFHSAWSAAEVARMEITLREPFANGHSFGRSGAYERIAGKLYLEVDPEDPANQRVCDLKLAPRNTKGKVEFWTDFFLLCPQDAVRGNRRLFYDVNNRGNKLALGAFNDAGGNDPQTLDDAGNGFLMSQGYSVLWCGWNGDVKPGNNRMLIGLPVATENGHAIRQSIYAEICVDQKSFSQPFYWGNSDPYPAISLDNSQARLTMRPDRRTEPVELPRDQWSFARWEDGQVVPDPQYLYIEQGFRPGWLYELVYVAENPRVTGLGFAAVRDAVSFFRYEASDRQGNPNPLADNIALAYIFGISQSGRFTHHFIHEDFNADEHGRIVFDGAMPHVGGGGKGQFNYRFAQTTRHGSQHEDNLYPSDFFPFTSVTETDPVTGQQGDSLQRARQAGHLPKIFFTETSTEYWARAASLLHTDVEGKRDLPLDPNVRLYFFTGAQHGNSSGRSKGIYVNWINTLDHRPLLRALLTDLDEWVSSGREPPPSSYPHIADGTLVDLATYRASFPAIPSAVPPETLYAPLRLDPGPRWFSEGIADHIPPRIGPAYVTLVPAVGPDGNELAGIRLPDIAVPLATYSGWNLRDPQYGAAGMLARWSGSVWPLPRGQQDRMASNDPRPSVRELYPTHADYLAKVVQATLQLRDRRLLLNEDVIRIIERASTREPW